MGIEVEGFGKTKEGSHMLYCWKYFLGICLALALVASFIYSGTRQPSSGIGAKGMLIVKPQVAEAESHYYNDNPEMAKSIPGLQASPEKKAMMRAKMNKANDEFARLKKLSKQIPLITGEMSLKVKVPNLSGEHASKEVIYEFDSNYYVACYEVKYNLSSAVLAAPWKLYITSDISNWGNAVVGGTVLSPGSGVLNGPVLKSGKYAKLEIVTVSTDGANTTFTLYSPRLYGLKTNK